VPGPGLARLTRVRRC